MPQTKIATCCYCGSRAALSLTGETRHELACGTCGAPISRLKMLRKDAEPAPSPAPRSSARTAPTARQADSRARKKPKKKKSLSRKMLGEVWDVIEDIFD